MLSLLAFAEMRCILSVFCHPIGRFLAGKCEEFCQTFVQGFWSSCWVDATICVGSHKLPQVFPGIRKERNCSNKQVTDISAKFFANHQRLADIVVIMRTSGGIRGC